MVCFHYLEIVIYYESKSLFVRKGYQVNKNQLQPIAQLYRRLPSNIIVIIIDDRLDCFEIIDGLADAYHIS